MNRPEQLPPLPFTYVRTTNRDEAQYLDSATAADPVGAVQKQHEASQWYTQQYWRQKGLPREQINFLVADRQITMYNYHQNPITDAYVDLSKSVLAKYASHFPQAIERVNWLLINDHSIATVWGDPEKYPLNGRREADDAIGILPRGLSMTPHRIAKVSNFEGTLTHEMAHPIQDIFQKEWEKDFNWPICDEYPEEWEYRLAADGTRKLPFNRRTGEVAPSYHFPLQPEQCVTNYGKISSREDICDSVVSYL